MKTVKFNDAGDWAYPDPSRPQFSVTKGQELDLPDDMADTVIRAKKGVEIKSSEPEPEPEPKNSPKVKKKGRA